MLSKTLKILIPVTILVAGLSIAGAIFYINREKALSPQEAAKIAMDYINQNLLEGRTASLISVKEENGIYKFRLKIEDSEYDSYVTRDGKLLFTAGIDLTLKPETQQESETSQQPQKLTCEDLKKSDEPSLEAFVVSKCPFGLQMQRILNEIVKNMPSLANNIKVRYIGSIQDNKVTSMHGDPEAEENLRQICIREEQKDKYWNYIACHIQKGEVDSCLAGANINKVNLNNCLTDATKGLNYAKEDFDSGVKYQVSGSPSLFLNGEGVSEFDFGGRTAEAVKTVVCCGFGQQPEICSQKLSETQAATGFSETYGSTSDSSSSEGGCAQ